MLHFVMSGMRLPLEPWSLLAYRKAMKRFAAWCAARHVASLPAEPETVAAFLTARMQDGKRASSLAA